MNKRFYGILGAVVLCSTLCGRVEAQPNILQQPISLLNQLLGTDLSLSIVAQSPVTTNLHYQWLRNGVIVPGATNAALPITSVQATNCASFSVVVSDGVGVAVSEPADVTVNVGIVQGLLDGLGGLIDALNLINTSGTIRSYNTNAVKQRGTPDIIPGDPGGSEVWFQWTPPTLLASGIVTFSTLGSDFDTTMAAYTGSEPSNLVTVPTCVNDDDDAGYLNSQISFYAKNGTTYLIAVDGFYGAKGNVVVSWTMSPGSDQLPTNKPAPQTIISSNGATVTLNSPWPGYKCAWLFNGQTVASNASSLSISNLGSSNVGAYAARYTTADGISVSAEASSVQINTLQDGSTSTNSTVRIKFLDSANTPFVQSTEMQKLGGGDTAVYSCSQVFSTQGNSDEPGEPVVANQVGAHPGWYTYVTPSSGTLVINTGGSGFNTILGVFTGPGNSFTTLTNIGAGYTTNYQTKGQPVVTITNLPAGQTNYIVVEGENGASGTVHLNLSLGAPASILEPPQSQSTAPGSNVTLYVSAGGAAPLSYVWQFNGTNIPGATNGTLNLTNVYGSMAGAYTVLVSNLFSFTTAQAQVTLEEAPVITAQPASHTAASNSTATLSVVATGAPAPAYQWFFNGAPVGTNGSSLSISNFQASDEGAYTVVLSNSVSVVTSAPATLLLDGPCRMNSFSVSNGLFSLQLVGRTGANFVIEASSNLVDWIPVATNSAPSGILNFTDTNASSFTRRFYRAIAN